ncbi:recombinase family protein [Arsenophonus sp. ENCA]|uniref:recombinase family protein n=1 Tax=Arsenophonus sp. ENCA TaxID=1987579 RepID=UPI0025BA7174|nr:recombinase family protein [Arsenophonus sp. ENCA]
MGQFYFGRVGQISIGADIIARFGFKYRTPYQQSLSAQRSLQQSQLDRLGRSIKHLITLISKMEDEGIHFHSLTDAIDTSTSAGRFFFHVMSALAQMERELIVERTKAGLAAARSRGRIGGRPQSLSFAQQQEAQKLLSNGHSRKQLALLYGVSLTSIYKYVPVKRNALTSHSGSDEK